MNDEIISSEEGEQRKKKTITYLKDLAIPFLETLPELLPLAKFPFKTQEDIAKRAVALIIVIQYAFNITQGEDPLSSKAYFIDILQKFDVVDQLTPLEQKLFSDEEPIIEEAVNITWQYEAYWVLIWALGLVDTLSFPDQLCDCDYAINVIFSCETYEAFYSKTFLRRKEEIIDEADKIYRLHWACVNNRIKGLEAPAGLNEGIIVERRRGLFWMMGEGEWDNIAMDT
jgi:hypothetical protein